MSICVGVVGAGFISEVHLKALSVDERVNLAWVIDTNSEVALQQAVKYGIPQTATDYRRMLDDPSVDVVDIAVPHFLHLPITLEALDAGKDVMLEKPIALDLNEADKLITKAETTGKQLLIKKYLRFSKPHQMAKELIDKDAIGRTYLGVASLYAQQLHWENDPENWHGVWEKAGGGVVMDAAIHLVDLMQFLFGRAKAINAITKRLVAENPDKAEDVGALNIEYVNGQIASIVCANCDNSLPRIFFRKEIYGTKGSLLIHDLNGENKLDLRVGGKTDEVVSIKNWWEEANFAAINHLVDCLVDGEKPVASLDEARHDLEIVLAVYQSNKEGKRIALSAD